MEYKFKKIGREATLADKCRNAIVGYIKNIEVGENKMPSEEDLALMLGVSRTTVREALNQLTAEGLITKITGQGYYAHRSVSDLKNRLDLYPDIYELLLKNYGNAKLVISDIKVDDATEECKRRFEQSNQVIDEVYSMRWNYYSNDSPKFVGLLEFPVNHIKKPIKDLKGIKGLPEFSNIYMESIITHCTMILYACSKEKASKIFGNTSKCALQWKESIFNLDDELVGYGVIYINPEEISLSINAALSLNGI